MVGPHDDLLTAHRKDATSPLIVENAGVLVRRRPCRPGSRRRPTCRPSAAPRGCGIARQSWQIRRPACGTRASTRNRPACRRARSETYCAWAGLAAVVWPVIVPSSTRHSLGSPSQPCSVLPSKIGLKPSSARAAPRTINSTINPVSSFVRRCIIFSSQRPRIGYIERNSFRSTSKVVRRFRFGGAPRRRTETTTRRLARR